MFRWYSQSENAWLFGLAALLGLAVGVAVTAFRGLFHWFHEFVVIQLGEQALGSWLLSNGIDPRWSIVAVLAGIGALVGWIMQRFVLPEKYSSAALVIEAVALAGGKLPYHKMPFKALASALSIGAGASVGAEDPSVQIASHLGSFLAHRIPLHEDRRRLLVGAGAASAIAAAFNAPLAGVFFSLELILGEFTAWSIGVVVLAAVIASGVAQSIQGTAPLFDEVNITLASATELPLYALLGFLLAGFSAVVLRYMYWQAHWWQRIKVYRPLKTALVGALIGCVGVFVPYILGTGESFMHDVLTGHPVEVTLVGFIGLALLKPILTSLSQNGGFVGGMFAPTLFMGIMLGNAYGLIIRQLLPNVAGSPAAAFAIAGMAGMLTGIVRIPMTAIMLVFEVTNDYGLILPIMLTTSTCLLLLERFGPLGLEALHLNAHGIRLPQGRDVDVMQAVLVEEVMHQPAPIIAAKATLTELREAFRQQHMRSLCVMDEQQRLYGIVTLGDLQQAFEEDLSSTQPRQIVGEICTRRVITCRPHESVWMAIRRMGELNIGRLPVLDSQGNLVGLLRRSGIMQAYNLAIAKKLQNQHTVEQIRLPTLVGGHTFDLTVLTGSAIDGQQIRQLTLPAEAIIAAIHRGDKLIIPHGSTQILAGDVLTIIADDPAAIVLQDLAK